MSILTILDVPHVKMDARHQNANSLGALVAQQLHHLRGENRIITVLQKLIPTVHLVMDSKSEIIILLSSFLGNPQPISRIKFCPVEVLVPVPASLTFHIRLLLVTSIHLLINKNFPIRVWRHELKQRITVVMLNNDIAQLRLWLIEWNQNNPKNTFALKATLAGC